MTHPHTTKDSHSFATEGRKEEAPQTIHKKQRLRKAVSLEAGKKEIFEQHKPQQKEKK